MVRSQRRAVYSPPEGPAKSTKTPARRWKSQGGQLGSAVARRNCRGSNTAFLPVVPLRRGRGETERISAPPRMDRQLGRVRNRRENARRTDRPAARPLLRVVTAAGQKTQRSKSLCGRKFASRGGHAASVSSRVNTGGDAHQRTSAGTAPRQPAAQKNASRLPADPPKHGDHIPRDTAEEPETKTRQCAKQCRESCIQDALAPSLSQPSQEADRWSCLLDPAAVFRACHFLPIRAVVWARWGRPKDILGLLCSLAARGRTKELQWFVEAQNVGFPPASQEAAMRAAFRGTKHESVSGCGRASGSSCPASLLNKRWSVAVWGAARVCGAARRGSRRGPHRTAEKFSSGGGVPRTKRRAQPNEAARSLPETLARMQNVLGVAAQLLPASAVPALLRERQVFDGVGTAVAVCDERA